MDEDKTLETFFAAARAEAPRPSAQLSGRILADAAAQHRAQASFWARLWDGLGGWPVATGLVAATVSGIWIGFAVPVTGLSGASVQETDLIYETFGLLPDVDTVFQEEG